MNERKIKIKNKKGGQKNERCCGW